MLGQGGRRSARVMAEQAGRLFYATSAFPSRSRPTRPRRPGPALDPDLPVSGVEAIETALKMVAWAGRARPETSSPSMAPAATRSRARPQPWLRRPYEPWLGRPSPPVSAAYPYGAPRPRPSLADADARRQAGGGDRTPARAMWPSCRRADLERSLHADRWPAVADITGSMAYSWSRIEVMPVFGRTGTWFRMDRVRPTSRGRGRPAALAVRVARGPGVVPRRSRRGRSSTLHVLAPASRRGRRPRGCGSSTTSASWTPARPWATGLGPCCTMPGRATSRSRVRTPPRRVEAGAPIRA